MEKLLLVDDDAELSSLLQRFLAGEGFLVEAAHSGADGIRKAAAGGYALILLDVMMPRVDGFEVLREVRSKLPTPVLMLTAKGDTRDRVLGLELVAAQNQSRRAFLPEAWIWMLERARSLIAESRWI